MNTPDIIEYVPLMSIVYNRYQPRTTMNQEELEKLANSIRQHTLLQKPTARIQSDGCYELAFGHKRFEAYKMLAAAFPEYKTMPLIIRELDDEQMFDLAWDENEERSDLNPIDEGKAYETWMREFDKTSKEAGLRFHTSEENIRAKIRLGGLPEPVKEKVREGAINENTARALLQMQRLASPAEVTKTVERIQKENGYSPESVIERAIDRLDNVVEFDSRGSWSLDMKKFPNNLLPVLDATMTKTHEKNIDHLINPPACSACPFHTKMRGNHYCGLKDCFRRKSVAWEAYSVELASKKLKIAIYNKEQDGGYVVLAGYEDSHKKLFSNRHADLRLLPKSSAGNSYQWGFEGLNNEHVLVVATGQSLGKLLMTRNGSSVNRSRGGKKTEKEKAEMRAMKIYRARRKEMMWECTGIAKSMFDNVPLEVLRKINSWHHIGIDDRVPNEYDVSDHGKADADTKAEFQRRELVWRLIMGGSSHYRRGTMAALLKDFQERTGFKPTKAVLKLAEQWDAEIEAVAKASGKKAGAA